MEIEIILGRLGKASLAAWLRQAITVLNGVISETN